MKDLFSIPKSPLTWRYLWLALTVAFGVRLIVGFTIERLIHPDQMFQYLEPAYRLVYGYGIVPWEYVYGIRSWLIPLFIAGLLKIFDVIGLGNPAYYIPMVETVFSAISLILVVGVYRLAQSLTNERAAIAAFLMACFWAYFIHYASAPLTTMLGATTLIWACVLILRPPTPLNLVILGALIALTLAIRFQLLPIVGLLNLFALIALRQRFAWVFLGNMIVVVIVGLIDVWAWGGFLSSFIDNFYYNMTEKVSERFGVDGPHYYALRSVTETGGLAILMYIGMFMLCRRAWPIWLSLAVGMLALHIPAHKEWRFIVWFMPFGMIGLGYVSVLISDRLRKYPLIWSGSAGFLVIWFCTVLWIHLLHNYDVYEPGPSTIDGISAIEKIRDDEDLTGLLIRHGKGAWGEWGGYYTLGRAIPVYYQRFQSIGEFDVYGDLNVDLDDNGTEIEMKYVSHIISGSHDEIPGYHRVDGRHQYAIYHRKVRHIPEPGGAFDFTVKSGFDFNILDKEPRGINNPPFPTHFPK